MTNNSRIALRLSAYAVLLLGLLLVYLKLAPYAADDAYIHLRIAKDFQNSGLPYYNPGQKVLGSSSPVWILVLYLAGFLLPLVPNTLAILNAAFGLAGAVLWAQAAQSALKTKSLKVEIPVLLLVLSTSFASGALLMETPLALALLAAGLLLHSQGRPASFALLALAAGVRPELGLLWLIMLLASSRAPHLAARFVWSLIGFLPSVLFVVGFFGWRWPQTIAAKTLVYRPSPSEFVQVFLRGALGESLIANGKVLLTMYVIGLVGLALYLIFSSKNSNSSPQVLETVMPLMLSAVLILAGYAVFQVLVFPWYLPLVTLPFLSGLFLFVFNRGRRLELLWFILFWTPLLGVFAKDLFAGLFAPELYTHFAGGARARKLAQVGQALGERYPAARLLAPEIGGLGYGFPGEIIDGMGLVTPEALKYHPLEVPSQRPSGILGVVPLGLAEDKKPELIVGLDLFLKPVLQSKLAESYVITHEPAFLEDDMQRLGQAKLWGSGLSVLIRKGYP